MKKTENNKENKKDIKKISAICGLSALCIAVLAGAYILTREPETEFVPASVETGSVTDSWEENADAVLPSETEQENTQITGTSSDRTQTVISEDENGSVSDLSGSTTKEAADADKPMETPVTADDISDPDRQPEYGDDVPQPASSAASSDESGGAGSDTADSSSDSHPGQVYDPVFGWVTPSNVQQDNIDNDGDINKQIGTMGGN